MITGMSICAVGYVVMKRLKDTADPYGKVCIGSLIYSLGLIIELNLGYTLWGPIVLSGMVISTVLREINLHHYDVGSIVANIGVTGKMFCSKEYF